MTELECLIVLFCIWIKLLQMNGFVLHCFIFWKIIFFFVLLRILNFQKTKKLQPHTYCCKVVIVDATTASVFLWIFKKEKLFFFKATCCWAGCILVSKSKNFVKQKLPFASTNKQWAIKCRYLVFLLKGFFLKVFKSFVFVYK